MLNLDCWARFYTVWEGDAMTHQAGEYYLASDDLVFTRSIRRIKVFKLFSSVVSPDCGIVLVVLS